MTSEEPTLALGGRTIIPGLAVGHAAFHWVVQSFVVALPEIQQTFGLSGVGVGGILAAREFATAMVKLPGGVAVDALRKYWGTVLAFDSGVLLTVCVALLGLFLYPDQPILTAAVFDAVDSEVASTGLGFVSFVGSLMAVASPLIAGGLYEGIGFEAVVYYVAGLFGLAAVVFVGAPTQN
jgi:sugar phosphate permease